MVELNLVELSSRRRQKLQKFRTSDGCDAGILDKGIAVIASGVIESVVGIRHEAMGNGTLILICQSGGKFATASDGSLVYSGGDAHALSVNKESTFDELMSEMSEMYKYDPDSMVVKYFLPKNNKILITISGDKDIQRLIDFHEGSGTVDVYVMVGEKPSDDVTTTPCSRSSRTTGTESVTPPDSLIPLPETVCGDMALLSTLFPSPIDAEDTRQLVISAPADSDIRQQKLIKSWKNCITGVHQRFNNVHDFRDALYKYSVAHGFTYCFKKNEGLRVTAKCKAEGCPWRIHASRVPTTQLFQIKTMNGTHTCKVGPDPTTRSKASRKLLASIVKEKLLETPKCKPKEIAEEIRRDFGIELGYVKAWRALESARGESQGSYKESYNQLPWFVDKIVETNPGSVVTLSTREDLSFHHLFVALHASLYGFQNGCRPLIFLDTLPIKSKYQSSLLTATALDGNDGIFPVAFGVVDAVSDDNWHWFLFQLKSALLPCQSITFVTDRQMRLRPSILSIFENSYHYYCLHHLAEDLKRDLKGSYTEEIVGVIVAHLYDAAQAYTPDEFRKWIDSIKTISSEAYDWIRCSEPENWANALFVEGSRYNQMSSHIAESFYSWVDELPELPIMQIINTICRKIMELIYTRRMDSSQWLTKLTPSLEDRLQNEILKTHSVQVLLGLGSSFEVCGGSSVNVVNIDIWDCNCKGWQLNGFPCVHAVAVLQHLGRNLPDYCSKFYTTEAFRLTYSESVNPIPASDQALQTLHPPQVQVPVQVMPPPLMPLTGPPKKRRIRWKGRCKRELHCSKCKGAGHNRKTCHVYA